MVLVTVGPDPIKTIFSPFLFFVKKKGRKKTVMLFKIKGFYVSLDIKSSIIVTGFHSSTFITGLRVINGKGL